MRERINIDEALRLYAIWQNWKLVSLRMSREDGTRFAHDAIQAAVRNYDKAKQ